MPFTVEYEIRYEFKDGYEGKTKKMSFEVDDTLIKYMKYLEDNIEVSAKLDFLSKSVAKITNMPQLKEYVGKILYEDDLEK